MLLGMLLYGRYHSRIRPENFSLNQLIQVDQTTTIVFVMLIIEITLFVRKFFIQITPRRPPLHYNYLKHVNVSNLGLKKFFNSLPYTYI